MKQVIGPKKHNLIQSIANKKYLVCYTSGNYGHFWAECWIDEKNADKVNYKTNEIVATIRNGVRVI